MNTSLPSGLLQSVHIILPTFAVICEAAILTINITNLDKGWFLYKHTTRFKGVTDQSETSKKIKEKMAKLSSFGLQEILIGWW